MQSLKSRLIHYVLKRKLAQMAHLSVLERRLAREKQAALAFKMPRGVRSEESRIGSVDGEWLRPHGAASNSILMYLHGGAYVMGSSKTHRTLAARLAKAANSSTYLLNYRLAPEHSYPAALDDAVTVYRELLRTHAGQPIAVAGDSAGGGLAVALAIRLRQEAITAPVALGLMSPWTDLTLSNESYRTKAALDPFFPQMEMLRESARLYAGAHPLEHPLISPQFAELAGLPPSIIHVGDREALLDDSQMLFRQMAQQGADVSLKIYPGMWHVWQIFGGRMRESDHSILEIGAFLKTHLNK